jgi:signal transduction histidine kinase
MAGPRVLVVEDDTSLHHLYERIVRAAGGVPDFAADGASATALFASGVGYACALIDRNLPDMNGLTLARSIKEKEPGTELLVVTGYANLESAIDFLRLGTFDYVLKPFRVEDLLERVRAALMRHQDEQEKRRRVVRERSKVMHLETELERRGGMLLHADRLATLGTLAGGVGHELNNITAVLHAAVVELQGTTEEKRPLDEGLVSDLARVVEHLRSHATNLLNLGRPGPDHVDRFDFCETVEQCVEMLRSVGKVKYVNVRLDLPADPVWVTVNRTRVEQILINLIGNAADAVAEIDEPTISITVWQDNPRGRAFCRIVDNGCGIPDEIAARVFEPYFTTKPVGRGTGLGLPTVRQIVEAYGGMIALTSAVGRGTSVVFDVPEARLPTNLPRGPGPRRKK